MLPFSGNCSPEKPPKKPKSPPPTSKNGIIGVSIDFVKPYTYVSLHPRSCLIIFIVAVQISLLSLSYLRHRPPPPLPPSQFTVSGDAVVSFSSSSPLTEKTLTKAVISSSYSPVTENNVTNAVISSSLSSSPVTERKFPSSHSRKKVNECELGKFYVYDLPAEFNVEIHKNCDKLSPFGSRCSTFSNNGFGLVAVEINRVVPANLANTWYWTDQFSSEIFFHNRLLHHKCRTLEAESAAAYYIPFYAGLEVGKFLWGDTTVKVRDAHCEMMLDYIERLPYFNRSKGWDHFIVMGRITWDFRRSKDEDWGSKCIHMTSMRNITRLLIERNPWDYHDVGIPYPTGFHPNTDHDVASWQRFVATRPRKSLFCFVGGTRGLIPNDFRGLLLRQCKSAAGSCRVVDCSGTRCANDTAGTTEILETFLDSEFCLQPRGDSFTRRSIFECMIAGSIPVFFWRRSAYLQYEWFLPGEPESYSVFIHRDEVKNGTSIKTVLEKYSKEEVKKMRDKVIEFIPKFIYAKPNEGLRTVKDAVDIAVDGVFKRIKEQSEKEFYW